MKKLLSLVLTAALCLTAVFVLTACYASKPVLMEDLVGTYQLTKFTRTGTGENAETHDLIAEKGIVAYLVVGADGKGYYVYKDNDVELYVKEVRIEYDYATEDVTEEYVDDQGNTQTRIVETKTTDLIDEIRYYTGDGSATHPGGGHENLGVNGAILNFYYAAIFQRKESQSVEYKKVDKAVDLSYVQGKLGQLPAATAYEVQRMGGWHTVDESYDSSEILYRAYNVDLATMTATYYYATKQDKIMQQSQVALTYSLSDDGTTLNVNLGDEQYTAYYNYQNVPSSFSRTSEAVSFFFDRQAGPFDLTQWASNVVEAYESMQNPV